MKSIRNIVLATLFSFMLTEAVSAQIIVAEKPHKPKVVVIKKNKPAKNFVWIDGHWKVKNNTYVWVEGSWVKARKNHVWIKGDWQRVPRGWKWIPGHWKRARF